MSRSAASGVFTSDRPRPAGLRARADILLRSPWLVAIVFVCLSGWYLAFAMQRYETSHLYGDEPEAVLVGISVWEDGDLDLANQFRHPDPHVFPESLTFKLPTPNASYESNFMPTNGALFSQPAFALFGMRGVLMLYAAMNIASLYLIFLVLRRRFGRLPSLLTVFLVGLMVPLAWHAASVWTEIPALLGVSAVLTLAPRFEDSRRAQAGAGLILAFLPWLHQKYVFLSIGLAVALLLERGRRRLWPALLSLPVAGFLGTVAYSYAIKGHWNFTQTGTTSDVSSSFDPHIGRFFKQPLAWFFDQTRGYLPYAPAWALVGVGLVFLATRKAGRRLLLFLAVGFVPYYLVYFAGPFLAGDAPPGRETLVALPALAVLLAAALSALRGVVAIGLATVVALPSIAFGTAPAFSPGMDVFFNNVGQPKLLNHISGPRTNWADLWPRMTADPGTWSKSRLLIDVLAAIFFVSTIYLASRLSSLRTNARPWSFDVAEAESVPSMATDERPR